MTLGVVHVTLEHDKEQFGHEGIVTLGQSGQARLILPESELKDGFTNETPIVASPIITAIIEIIFEFIFSSPP